MWSGCIWLRIKTSGGSCEHGFKPSGAIKGGEFID
jgi:hypothetical protein